MSFDTKTMMNIESYAFKKDNFAEIMKDIGSSMDDLHHINLLRKCSLRSEELIDFLEEHGKVIIENDVAFISIRELKNINYEDFNFAICKNVYRR